MEARPEVLLGKTIRTMTGCGNIYITLNSNKEEALQEVFAVIGKSGVCTCVFNNTISMIISVALRSGVEPEVLMKKLIGHQCDRYDGSLTGITSCPDAIGRAIGYHLGLYNEKLQSIPKDGQ